MVIKSPKQQKGFSLIELMIVVGIIGILATIAMPRFRAFQLKARQSEAKTQISHIRTLEDTYFVDNNSYIAIGANGADRAMATTCVAATAGADALGLAIPCPTGMEPLYGYAVGVYDGAGWVTADNMNANVSYAVQAATGTGANNRLAPACATANEFVFWGDNAPAGMNLATLAGINAAPNAGALVETSVIPAGCL